MSCFPAGFWEKYPHTATIITTYKCNAACKECCFECNPGLSSRLSLIDMTRFIDEAHQRFKGLRLVVFSGGECFLLGDDLFKAIAHASALGLLTRCVSNGYWGKNPAQAAATAGKLRKAGISEMNFSTGKDHVEWVPLTSVIGAAKALADAGIPVLVTVEQDTPESSIAAQLLQDPCAAELRKDDRMRVQFNSWMPFYDTSETRKPIDHRDQQLRTGCDQVFENVVLTPHQEISACCGLTFEHIPEMKLGRYREGTLYSDYTAQSDDFMKVWLRTEGPYSILEQTLPEGHALDMESIVHPCQACAHLHTDPQLRQRVRETFVDAVAPVSKRFNAMAILDLIYKC